MKRKTLMYLNSISKQPAGNQRVRWKDDILPVVDRRGYAIGGKLREIKKAICFVMFFAVFTSGCAQLPVTERKTVDNRPQLTFISNGKSDISSYRVSIDGFDKGVIEPYSDSKRALRVLPGTHIVNIYSNGELICSQKIHIDEGVNREIVVERKFIN